MQMYSLLLLLTPPLAESCSAAKNHPHFQRRNFPPLFTLNKNSTKTEKLCAIQLRGRDSLSCQAVDVNPEAFLAKSLTVPVSPDTTTITNSVLDLPEEEEEDADLRLVKRMQLGLALALHDKNTPATAQVQYSGRTGNVIFVIKAGRVYGSLTEGGLTYSLEPCLEKPEKKLLLASFPPCHLWIKALKKKQLV